MRSSIATQMNSCTAVPPDPLAMPDCALPASTRLDEYEIVGVLAQGSFAVVYRAFDHALNLQVAIKEYLPDVLALRGPASRVVLRSGEYAEAFDRGLQAFIGEAQALAQCEHPSLVRVLRIPRFHGTVYRVMPYCPGPTLLEHRLALDATPDAHTLRTWLDDLLGALQVLHDAGFVHGSVAPGNILLQHGARPLLLGFNAVGAALISERTQSMMATLEPCFEPIEQRAPMSFKVAGPWTDLYSLAATLHFCIGGRLPTPSSGHPSARAFEPLGEVWRRLGAERPALGAEPAWLQALDACLCEEPLERPQSVTQLRSMLDAQPAAQPTSAPALESVVPPAPAAAAAAETLPVPTHGPMPDPAVGEGEPAMAEGGPAIADGSHEGDQGDATLAREQPQTLPGARGAEGVAPRGGRRARLLVAAAVLALVAMLALFAWPVKKASDAESRASPQPAPSTVEPGPKPAPSKKAVTPPVTPAATPKPAPGGVPAEGVAASVPTTAAPATAAAAAPPARATPAAPAPPAAPAALPAPVTRPADRYTAGPRQLCADSVGYALLQCMRTQCAKRAWAKHEQCVRLRTQNKIS